mgnify:CR=1 FL=1
MITNELTETTNEKMRLACEEFVTSFDSLPQKPLYCVAPMVQAARLLCRQTKRQTERLYHAS